MTTFMYTHLECWYGTVAKSMLTTCLVMLVSCHSVLKMIKAFDSLHKYKYQYIIYS